MAIGKANREKLIGNTFNITYKVDRNGEPIARTKKETLLSSNKTIMHLKNFVNFKNHFSFHFRQDLRGLQTRLQMYQSRDDFETKQLKFSTFYEWDEFYYSHNTTRLVDSKMHSIGSQNLMITKIPITLKRLH